MKDWKDPREVIDLLAEHEESLSTLYAEYAMQFPGHRELWTGLASEETAHAAWIRAMAEDIEAKDGRFNDGRFRAAGIRASLRYVETEIARARAGSVSPLQALSVGKGIEDALLERRFFEVFPDDTRRMRKTLSRLDAETESHRERLLRAWNETRRPSRV